MGKGFFIVERSVLDDIDNIDEDFLKKMRSGYYKGITIDMDEIKDDDIERLKKLLIHFPDSSKKAIELVANEELLKKPEKAKELLSQTLPKAVSMKAIISGFNKDNLTEDLVKNIFKLAPESVKELDLESESLRLLDTEKLVRIVSAVPSHIKTLKINLEGKSAEDIQRIRNANSEVTLELEEASADKIPTATARNPRLGDASQHKRN
jgi:hypothetical protein